MSFLVFLQIFANIIFAVGLFVAFARLRRPAKDDPRLSKGLQLLSSKIAVLEDLSDRTETQVQQMLQLLDQKSKELQAKIVLADQQVAAVRQSMNQSLEVAQIFQDKIPHNEIIERQNSVKYIRAARLAHAGVSVADIAKQVDLPLGEIEFIAKVNRENLSFREEDLPAWAREPQPTGANIDQLAMAAEIPPATQEFMPVPPAQDEPPSLSPEQEGLVQKLNKLQFEMKNLDLELAGRGVRGVAPDFSQAFDQPTLDSTSLERLGAEFRRAVEQAEKTSEQNAAPPVGTTAVGGGAKPELHWPQSVNDSKSSLTQTSQLMTSKPGSEGTVQEKLAATAQVPLKAPHNPELEAARAAAAAIRTHQTVASQAGSIANPSASSGSSSREPKIVRRVEFPRI